MYNKDTYPLLEALSERFKEDKDTALESVAHTLIKISALCDNPIDLVSLIITVEHVTDILEEVNESDWHEVAVDLKSLIQYMLVEVFSHGHKA